jgi:hypothetical protein
MKLEPQTETILPATVPGSGTPQVMGNDSKMVHSTSHGCDSRDLEGLYGTSAATEAMGGGIPGIATGFDSVWSVPSGCFNRESTTSDTERRNLEVLEAGGGSTAVVSEGSGSRREDAAVDSSTFNVGAKNLEGVCGESSSTDSLQPEERTQEVFESLAEKVDPIAPAAAAGVLVVQDGEESRTRKDFERLEKVDPITLAPAARVSVVQDGEESRTRKDFERLEKVDPIALAPAARVSVVRDGEESKDSEQLSSSSAVARQADHSPHPTAPAAEVSADRDGEQDEFEQLLPLSAAAVTSSGKPPSPVALVEDSSGRPGWLDHDDSLPVAQLESAAGARSSAAPDRHSTEESGGPEHETVPRAAAVGYSGDVRSPGASFQLIDKESEDLERAYPTLFSAAEKPSGILRRGLPHETLYEATQDDAPHENDLNSQNSKGWGPHQEAQASNSEGRLKTGQEAHPKALREMKGLKVMPRGKAQDPGSEILKSEQGLPAVQSLASTPLLSLRHDSQR